MVTLLIPIITFVTFKKSKRFFFPFWITFIVANGFLLLLNFYYLTGSGKYRDYLDQLNERISSKVEYWENSLCNKANCVRIDSYYDSRSMSLAFIILGIITNTIVIFSGFVINVSKKKDNELELIMWYLYFYKVFSFFPVINSTSIIWEIA